jgi:replicative DNA helicase
VDGLTLADRLEEEGKLKSLGGRGGLMELIENMPSASNILTHSNIVRQHALRRALIRVGRELFEQAYSMAEPVALAADIQSQLLSLVWGRDARRWLSLGEIAQQGLDWMNRAAEQEGTLSGITTGLTDLDSMTGGWQRTDMVVVGARPSMGKTALALGAAIACALSNYVVAMFSLEMSATQLGLRFLARGSRRNLYRLRQPRGLNVEDWRSIIDAGKSYESLPFFVDDAPMQSIDSIRAKVRALKARTGLDLLIIDYLQLIEIARGSESRQAGLADISRSLKLMAKELEITVLVLSQLNRECERREDKRPLLSDLRESGGLEQDADIVIMLYRDEVYDSNTKDGGIAELILRKHRNGAIATVRSSFRNETARKSHPGGTRMNTTFFFLPIRLPNENQLHKLLRSGGYPVFRKKALADVALLLKSYYHKGKIPFPKIPKQARCRFRFDWHVENRKVDPDNIAAGGRKIILDAMRQTGMWHNDGWSNLLEGEIVFLDAFHLAALDSGVQVFVQWFEPGEEIPRL